MNATEMKSSTKTEIEDAIKQATSIASMGSYDIDSDGKGVYIHVSIPDNDGAGELPGEGWDWTGDSNADQYGDETSRAVRLIRIEDEDEIEAAYEYALELVAES